MRQKIIEIKMFDGSIFRFPNATWQKAFLIKYGDRLNEAILAFKEATKNFFDAKLVPTKFGTAIPWEENAPTGPTFFRNHAELGREVMYVCIRAALMGIILSEQTDGKAAVIGISKEGKLVEYTKNGKRELTLPRDEQEDES